MMLNFLPVALEELVGAAAYYEDIERGLGKRFRLEAESLCNEIVRHPLLWRERSQGYRRVNFAGFPYYVAYVLEEENIWAVAIGHTARRPEYWHGRLR